MITLHGPPCLTLCPRSRLQCGALIGPLFACPSLPAVGCTVEHEDPRDIQKKIDEGEIVW